MTHIRTRLRMDVRAALVVAMIDVTWPQRHWGKEHVSDLPRGGVATPRTRNDLIDVGSVNRAIDLIVVLKREGGDDIEDILDADSTLIERAVLPVLEGYSTDFGLVETQIAPDGRGSTTVGELSMLFRVVTITDEDNPE